MRPRQPGDLPFTQYEPPLPASRMGHRRHAQVTRLGNECSQSGRAGFPIEIVIFVTVHE
jgi:hypothetical protein